MKAQHSRTAGLAILIAFAAGLAGGVRASQDRPQQEQPFRFRTGVELINVTATVTDAGGRFVAGLGKEDFRVYQDDELQQISHFNAERVPVSLGIVLDTSGSMDGEKWDHAREALDRFVLELLGPDDEVFLYAFSNYPNLIEDWTTDRTRLSRAMGRILPRGGTAMYDTLVEAVPLAERGQHRKKAIVVISDGNDTNSTATVQDVRHLVRDSEILVYAIGIDGESTRSTTGPFGNRPRVRIPIPLPFPGGRRRPFPMQPPWGGVSRVPAQQSSRVNASALRELTDDSGGRTEIVRDSQDLDPATANIADELSQQYFLAYPAAAKKDGRWHSIRVEVKDRRYTVRARRGYMAT